MACHLIFCTLQHLYFATHAICNTCTLHVKMCIVQYPQSQQDKSARWITQTDQLNWSVRQTRWTDQFSMLEALDRSHIGRLTFQFVHCCSFRVRPWPCLGNQSQEWNTKYLVKTSNTHQVSRTKLPLVYVFPPLFLLFVFLFCLLFKELTEILLERIFHYNKQSLWLVLDWSFQQPICNFKLS